MGRVVVFCRPALSNTVRLTIKVPCKPYVFVIIGDVLVVTGPVHVPVPPAGQSNSHWYIAGAVPAAVPVDGEASNLTVVPTGTGDTGEYVNTAVGPVVPPPTVINFSGEVWL